MKNWKSVKLGEVVSVLGDGLHGTPKYDQNGEYYFINGSNLVDGRIVITADTKRTNESEYEKYKKDINDRTILVSINGTLGNIGLYNGEKCMLGKSACYFNVNNDVDKLFIRYAVSTMDFMEYLTRYANGTTIKNVPLKAMREFPFMLPPLPEQRRIAGILGCLDAKIELNRRMNANIEAQAAAIFKNWFVDFEPFRDAGMTDSPLGKIPKGWRVGKLGEMMEVKYGKAHQYIEDGNVPVYGSGGIMRYANETIYDRESVLIPRKGTLNNVFYTDEPFWAIDTMFYTVMRQKFVARYMFHVMSSLDLVGMNSGSAVPSMTTNILYALDIIFPPIEPLQQCDALCSRLFDKIKNNKSESRILSSLRDVLLPRLMRGEV